MSKLDPSVVRERKLELRLTSSCYYSMLVRHTFLVLVVLCRPAGLCSPQHGYTLLSQPQSRPQSHSLVEALTDKVPLSILDEITEVAAVL